MYIYMQSVMRKTLVRKHYTLTGKEVRSIFGTPGTREEEYNSTN